MCQASKKMTSTYPSSEQPTKCVNVKQQNMQRFTSYLLAVFVFIYYDNPFIAHNITFKPLSLNKQPPLCPMCHDCLQPFPIKSLDSSVTLGDGPLVRWAMPWVGPDPGRFRRHCPNVKKTGWHPRFCAPCVPRVAPRVVPRVVPRVAPVYSFPHIHSTGTTSKTVHENRCFTPSMATVPPHRQFATTR